MTTHGYHDNAHPWAEQIATLEDRVQGLQADNGVLRHGTFKLTDELRDERAARERDADAARHRSWRSALLGLMVGVAFGSTPYWISATTATEVQPRVTGRPILYIDHRDDHRVVEFHVECEQ